MLLLFALIVGVGSSWGQESTVLFHETFGNNSGSAREWNDSYSVKSGVAAVYSGITSYTVTNVKQSKNTVGSTESGLLQSSTASEASIIIGPLNVADYSSLVLTYQWKAGSIKGTYSTQAYYATSATGSYTELTGTGNGATTFVLRSYNLPAAAQMSTLYIKIVWKTSNTQAVIDEVDLAGVGGGTTPSLETNNLALTGAPVALSFDLYNNSAAQTISYTTSSTGAVTVSANDYVTTTVDATNKTITVTPIAVTPSEQTITVSQAADDTYAAGSVTFTVTITNSDPNQPGSENKPYTVAEARAAIDANSGVTGVYATGIVSEIVTEYNSQYGNISYNISADGLTTSDQLQAYRGKSYNGDNFTSEDDIQVGDIVVVYGNLKKYNSTYEFDANNQLVSLKRAGVANLVFGQESYTVGVGGELTITASSDSDGAITYSSSNTDVAEIDATTGVVTAKAEGTTIITATIAATDELKGTTATVELTVTDSRAEAGLAWSGEEVNIELNAEEGDYTLPTLTNPNNLTVTYSSSNETVALVDETTGEVIVETSEEGTATITATFAGNDTYKAGSASYTITITDPNQKGTKLNPYTVAEVIGGTATGNGIYVLGYIVGEFVGNTTDPRTSGFTTDANIALADEFTTSPTAAASIPVQLSTDVLKSTWGNNTTGGTMGYQVLIKGNKDTYFSVNGIKNTTEVVAIQKVVSISDAKYATFSSAYPFDFSKSGITVYTAKANGTSVSLTKVEDGIVPAKTGVVLFSESVVTNKNVPITTTTKTSLENNEMVANVVRAKVYLTEGDKTNYILSNEDAGVGFYKAAANGAYLPANRAYLSTTATATGNAPFLGFDGNETTGINSVERGALSVEGCYTLDGRRVAQPTKGLYIVNGKKVILK